VSAVTTAKGSICDDCGSRQCHSSACGEMRGRRDSWAHDRRIELSAIGEATDEFLSVARWLGANCPTCIITATDAVTMPPGDATRHSYQIGIWADTDASSGNLAAFFSAHDVETLLEHARAWVFAGRSMRGIGSPFVPGCGGQS